MVVIVSVAVLHVEAVIPLDARGFTDVSIADFVTNAIRAGGNCQQCHGRQDRGCGSQERNERTFNLSVVSATNNPDRTLFLKLKLEIYLVVRELAVAFYCRATFALRNSLWIGRVV
jgi:hypothetical protein